MRLIKEKARGNGQVEKTPKSPANQVKLRTVIVTMPAAKARAFFSKAENAPLQVTQTNSVMKVLVYSSINS